jgi:hypothetical protein
MNLVMGYGFIIIQIKIKIVIHKLVIITNYLKARMLEKYSQVKEILK